MPPRPRPAARLALAAGLLLALSACSGGDGEPAPAGSSERPTAEPVTTTTQIGRVVGELSEDRRRHLEQRVAAVVDGWWDAAYLGGDYPRPAGGDGFADAFPGFTRGAADRAAADLALMSNAGVAEDLDAVVATRRNLRIDVLTVKRRPVGVTARFSLGMRLVGETERRDTVTGRLFMTFQGGSWQVFGYDVNRGQA